MARHPPQRGHAPGRGRGGPSRGMEDDDTGAGGAEADRPALGQARRKSSLLGVSRRRLWTHLLRSPTHRACLWAPARMTRRCTTSRTLTG